jgi:ATP-dependent Lhr-like helicase
VARGFFAADGFDALRALLEPETRLLGLRRTARGLRRGASGGLPREGRWALLPAANAGADAEELAEAVAEQLLSRWGVVFRDLLARESFAVPYRDLIWAFRRMEARGAIRGGRFVTGFVGEQYALPEAVELLRSVRRSEPNGERVSISACDPLNLAGILLPGPRVPAQRGNVVTYLDGVLVSDDSEVRASFR